MQTAIWSDRSESSCFIVEMFGLKSITVNTTKKIMSRVNQCDALTGWSGFGAFESELLFSDEPTNKFSLLITQDDYDLMNEAIESVSNCFILVLLS